MMTTLSAQRLAVCLLAVSISACARERPESFYGSLPEARRSGAIERGWVPAWLPETATEIREVHDIDTNESLLAFAMPPQQQWMLSAWTFPGDCRRVAYSSTVQPGFSRGWWPDSVQLERSYDIFRCEQDGRMSSLRTWVGRHKSGTHGLHWRAHVR